MTRTTGTIEQYVGRRVDLAAYHGMVPSGPVKLTQALALDEQGGALVTGVQKVAQRFLLELLRAEGTTLLSDSGTLFITELHQGRFVVPADLMGAFARGVVTVRRILQTKETDEDPDDERFVDAPIESVELFPGGAKIRFQIVTRAGTARDFIFPLEVSLRGTN